MAPKKLEFAPEREFLSYAEMAAITGLSVDTLRRRAAEGKIVAYRTGRSVKFHRSDVERLFA